MADIDAFLRFVGGFTRQTVVHRDDLMKMGREIYHVPSSLRPVLKRCKAPAVFAGTLLASEWGDTFKPGVALLALLARTDAKRVVVNPKAAWLCVCGRPPLLSSVVARTGDPGQGDLVLIIDGDDAVLGYGAVRGEWGSKKGIVALRYDIGDFLRRERKVMRGRRRARR